MESLIETPPATAESPPSSPRRSHLFREIVETALLTAVIFLIVNAATGRFKIDGQSMEPSLHTEEYVIVDKLTYVFGSPQRGDVVVLYLEGDPKDYIKRVIGLPGETIEIARGTVYIDGLPLSEPYVLPSRDEYAQRTLGVDEYFVMGDNRGNSQDSRRFGPIHFRNIVGRAWIVYWPPSAWSLVSHHSFTASAAP